MRKIYYLVVAVWIGAIACQSTNEQSGETEEPSTLASDSMDVDTATGLAMDETLPIVVGNCTGCHSAQLISQNRATREGWQSIIVWMQKNHKLWDLGENETVILDYLEKHYAPEAVGRRQNLENIEWYDLEESS